MDLQHLAYVWDPLNSFKRPLLQSFQYSNANDNDSYSISQVVYLQCFYTP